MAKKKYSVVRNWCGGDSWIVVTDKKPVAEVYSEKDARIIARLLNAHEGEKERRKP